MSWTAPTSMVAVGELGYGGLMAPFTALQWQELEQQAIIYKYLVAGMRVPPDLVAPIYRSLEALSASFVHHPGLGHFSYYGKKLDPEPGRCRRTDGKKWRCSKDAHPDSRYCERHMNRGRNRSRKPVESQSTTRSFSTATSHTSNGVGGNGGSSQHMPLYSVGSEGSSFGSNVRREPISYGIEDKESRYIHGLTTPKVDGISFSSEASGRLGLGSTAGNATWRLVPSQTSTSSFLKLKSDSQMLGQNDTANSDPTENTLSKQQCFNWSDAGARKPVNQGQNPAHRFFSEWPTTKESWSNLDDGRFDENAFSSTQLSMSIPSASSSDFHSRISYSTNDA